MPIARALELTRQAAARRFLERRLSELLASVAPEALHLEIGK